LQHAIQHRLQLYLGLLQDVERRFVVAHLPYLYQSVLDIRQGAPLRRFRLPRDVTAGDVIEGPSRVEVVDADELVRFDNHLVRAQKADLVRRGGQELVGEEVGVERRRTSLRLRVLSLPRR